MGVFVFVIAIAFCSIPIMIDIYVIRKALEKIADRLSKSLPYFTPEDVRRMREEEVRQNYTAIMKSMEKWK